MPARRLLMRKIREVLRLRHELGLSHQAVARASAVGVGTVNRYLRRAAEGGLGWPLPTELDDTALEARLFPRAAPVHDRVRPDCAYIHRELKRDGVTLQLLWEEYAQVHPLGYRYTQFCEIYRQWARRLRPSMRQVHRAGEKTFIDFSGKRPALVDPCTGELRRVELFVAVLGASNLTYAEATATQQLPDWVDAHIRMVEYFGGTTALWVPDQLKSAITRPCRYEPGVNRTYEDLAAHYGAVVVPARPRKPKDKAAAEAAVLLAQRWILARLRDETFFGLGALNQAIRVLLDELNDRPMQKLGISRRALYEQLDRPALRPLPPTRYVLAYWKHCRVNIDYHVQIDRHAYSVPFQLLREQVEVRYTTTTVEVFFKGRRVASHPRGPESLWRTHRPPPARAGSVVNRCGGGWSAVADAPSAPKSVRRRSVTTSWRMSGCSARDTVAPGRAVFAVDSQRRQRRRAARRSARSGPSGHPASSSPSRTGNRARNSSSPTSGSSSPAPTSRAFFAAAALP